MMVNDALKDDDGFDAVDDVFGDDDDDDDDDAINRWPFIGIDLGTMLSADFAAAAVLIRLPFLNWVFTTKQVLTTKYQPKLIVDHFW